MARGPARGADPDSRRDRLPRPREPARPGEGRERDAGRASQPRGVDRRASRRGGSGAPADDGGEENAAPAAGSIRARDGGPGPGERTRRRSALGVRDPNTRPGAEPGQRRDRARRRGGSSPCHERSAPGGPAEGDAAPRSRVSRGDTSRLAAVEPLRRARGPSARGRARVPEGRADGRARDAAAARPGRRRAHHVRRQLSHGEPRTGPLRGLGTRSAWRRRGHGGDGLHADAAGLACPRGAFLASYRPEGVRGGFCRAPARSRTRRASRRPSRRSSSGPGAM